MTAKMTAIHQTFKVCVIYDDNIENFYIKHYIDDFSPTFLSFKNKIYNRNPKLSNNPSVKCYWIDDENDEIIVTCEEDFRVYAEHGAHRKLYFSVKTDDGEEKTPVVSDSQVASASPSGSGSSGKEKIDDETTETDDVNERKKRTGKKKDIKLKFRHHERHEKRSKKDDEDSPRKERQKHLEDEINKKILEKQQKYLERHQKRCEKVRRMFQTVMDPANLSSTITTEGVGAQYAATTSSAGPPPSAPESEPVSLIYPSPDQIKQLTTVISNVLQPCNLINKILGDVIGTIIPPQVPQNTPQETPKTPANSEDATPASGLGITVAQNDELIRKITESCNQILNSQNLVQDALKNLQGSQESLDASANQAAMRNDEVIKKISESANSLIDSQNVVKGILESMNGSQTTGLTSSSGSAETQIEVEMVPVPGNFSLGSNNKEPSLVEDSILVVTPPASSMRSRESSIEVHDGNSMSDDGDRSWTIIDETGSPKKSPKESPKYTGAIPKSGRICLLESSEDEMDEIPIPVIVSPSVPVTAPIQASAPIRVSPEPVQVPALIRVSLEPVIVQASAPIRVSPEPAPVPSVVPAPVEKSTETTSIAVTTASTITEPVGSLANLMASRPTSSTGSQVQSSSASIEVQTEPTVSTQTQSQTQTDQANQAAQTQTAAVGPAVIVYHEIPKINRAVHTMVEMGYSNEDNWLTQLCLNVNGDVNKALAFLTPNK